ncbi:MAG: glycosyl hydrolase family 28-related protein [Phycisphaerae bacterium]
MRLHRLMVSAPLVHLAGPVFFIVLLGTFGQSACGNSSVKERSLIPWERQYKIKPSEKNRLTPADVLGPDGVVYPNWTKCGVQGGIPKAKAVASIEDFGAKADDDADDSEALAKACEAAGKMGGGAVLLGEGTYYLDRPVTVRHDDVVIRGQGPGKTRLIFRYSIPENGVVFYNPPAGSRVGRNTRLEMHCKPAGLMKMTMMLDDVVIGQWSRGQHSGNTFGFTVYGRSAAGKVPDGRRILKGIAEYKDGTKRTGEIPIILDSNFDADTHASDRRDTRPVADSRAAITFAGRGTVGGKLKLAKDGKRGDMTLELESTEGLRVGDCVLIDGPATQRWKKLTKNACKWGVYRQYEVIISNIKNNTITINQPLRIEFPTIDGSYVQKVVPIQRCGIESLYIEQTENLWISSVVFYHGWNCWAKDVTVKKCGRFPVYGSMAKWCEIRDCVFDDAWFKGGGGTAYTGWDKCWDCLMENVETFKMRHAPLFQWATSGCVIRKSVFHESDGQWHAGWTNENLIEQCVIESVRGHGGYGYGMWASPPQDAAHGPNGPRNVVYNCDVSSPREGVWMGGMNENWLILYSRFIVDNGPGVSAKTSSFDHIVKDNVFVLKDGKSPMIFLATSDCIGAEIIGNGLYGGSGRFVAGKGKPAVVKDNKAFMLDDAPRPIPEVPSIYEWQQKR